LINEEADHFFGLGAISVGDVCPYNHILLPAIPAQEQLNPRQQCHEQRHSLAAAERNQL
jgi:hypothetical protein